MEVQLPSRSEDGYDIGNNFKFEIYEYTNFITYELAMRNINVISLLNLSPEVLVLYNTFSVIANKYKNVEASEEVVREVENELKIIILDLFKHYNIDKFNDNINSLTLENIKDVFSDIINEIAEELYEKYYIIYQNDIEELNDAAKELYNPLKYLERDGLLTQHMNRVYDGEKNHKATYNINFTENKYFMVYQEIQKNKKDFSLNVIYPKFESAMRDFTDTKVALNLNLSENELVDYIKKIKKNYDSKNSIVKTKRELLEEELEETDDIKSFTIDKWADNFFIYDYFLYHQVHNIDKTDKEIKREIQIELTKFHGVRVSKDDDEIKSKKDTKYKYIPLEEYKIQEEYGENDDIFETILDENYYISIRSIDDKYKLINKYIQGKNPLYKTLLEK